MRFKFGHNQEQRGSKTQASLYQMMQRLLPDVPVYANHTVSKPKVSNTKPQDELKWYEFDVSKALYK
jgi:hypothetical protein